MILIAMSNLRRSVEIAEAGSTLTTTIYRDHEARAPPALRKLRGRAEGITPSSLSGLRSLCRLSSATVIPCPLSLVLV